ncbi:alpha-L-fucosidase [Pelagicoccus sp. SDUM812002]|uniref:alpha-L-fucosidase n=1 Tax=Pelagicoccus sp. SDUM812002 TaxID=3041266 RepID=UPI0028103BC9|nr:alpha-L-fucosidase [Pelagicoccus sp. SDUM812002]MDQ8187084.1 alpha-L-fucosidase [Pelagicoccus sp. SDUM812002]
MFLRTTKLLSALLLCFVASNATAQMKDPMDETPEAKDARLGWWKEARFGMFIHWGVYAELAGYYKGDPVEDIGEWIMHHGRVPIDDYEAYARMFNPLFFDADAWVSLAKQAGMKYIVITSKHHDGFALWDSKVTDWDITDASPFQRDILAELADACRTHDIKLCFYHSIMDWHHPAAQAPLEPEYNRPELTNPNFPRYYETYLKPQLNELLTQYGDIGILWFDGEWIDDYTTDMGKDLYRFVRQIQPGLIVNNRIDKGRQGYAGFDKEGNFAGDYGTPEQEIPATGVDGLDWESCMTMNDTWGWKAYDTNWKTSDDLIRNLVEIVSKGGNFLLNVGPTPEGVIPAASIERLQNMGTWMETNAASIYGARASPFPQPDWGRYTQTDDALYAHLFTLPEGNEIVIPTLASGQTYGEPTFLATAQPLTHATKGETLQIKLPDLPDPAPVTVIRIPLGSPSVLAATASKTE